MSSVTSQLPLILLVLLFCIAGTPVSAIPPLPYELYGVLTIDGNPAPAGIQLIAKINDQIVGELETETLGMYGGSGTFDRRLIVNAEESDIGEYITFWIGDSQATQKTTMQAGMSQNLDLTFIEGEEGGTIDASLPIVTLEQLEPTQTPLMAAPLLGLLAAIFFMRRKNAF
jgi:hypothetical protein